MATRLLRSGAGARPSEAGTHNPDIILLDLGLPDMDGVEVTRQLREFSEAAIIVLSATTRMRASCFDAMRFQRAFFTDEHGLEPLASNGMTPFVQSAAQVPFSHLGRFCGQSLSSMHWTHRPRSLQSGSPASGEQSVFVRHSTQRPRLEQSGVAGVPLQSAAVAHCAHCCVLGLHFGVSPEHCVSLVHELAHSNELA